jgi:hypothetical protein
MNTNSASASLLDPDRPRPAAHRGADEWRERAHLLSVVGEVGGAVRAARSGLAVATGSERREMLTVLLETLCAANCRSEAQLLHHELIAELRAGGRCDEAALEERIGLALYGATGEFALEALEMELLRLPNADVPATVRARVRTRLARERLRSGVEGVRELLDAALSDLNPTDSRLAFSTAMLLRIQFERESQKFGAAVDFIRRLLASEPDRGTRLSALLERAKIHAFWGEVIEGAQLINEAETLALEIVGHVAPDLRDR